MLVALVVGVGAVGVFVVMFSGVLDSSTGSGPSVRFTHELNELTGTVSITVRHLGGADSVVIRTAESTHSVSTVGLKAEVTPCESSDVVEVLAYQSHNEYHIGDVSVKSLSEKQDCR